MARVLIIAGGARGRTLAASLIAQGHAVRITTRDQAGRAAIESVGAECWIGTPDRVATLRYALESVTIACWLLGNACGDRDAVEALHSSRLEFFVNQTIDTTVRGLLYEAAGAVAGATVCGWPPGPAAPPAPGAPGAPSAGARVATPLASGPA